jgi:DNA polymerase
MTKEEKLKALNQLKKEMLADKNLPLRRGATNLVFGEGDPDAKIFCLGEGPGYYEDQKGRPFVGNAGSLLNQLLQLIKVPREKVWITNVVCYRPPENRDPEPSEIAAFQPYIDRMIEIIKPKIIVTLGRFSMAKFIPNSKITAIHGKAHVVDWNGRKMSMVPMYHPAAALRRTDVMTQIKDDFQKLPDILREIDKPDIKQMQLV